MSAIETAYKDLLNKQGSRVYFK